MRVGAVADNVLLIIYLFIFSHRAPTRAFPYPHHTSPSFLHHTLRVKFRPQLTPSREGEEGGGVGMMQWDTVVRGRVFCCPSFLTAWRWHSCSFIFGNCATLPVSCCHECKKVVVCGRSTLGLFEFHTLTVLCAVWRGGSAGQPFDPIIFKYHPKGVVLPVFPPALSCRVPLCECQ